RSRPRLDRAPRRPSRCLAAGAGGNGEHGRVASPEGRISSFRRGRSRRAGYRAAMSEHVCTVAWERHGAAFSDLKYSRAHRWRFDGGVELAASASPHVVRAPFSDPAGVDPEEAFVAALSSCHMLTFLWLAAKAGFVVDSY